MNITTNVAPENPISRLTRIHSKPIKMIIGAMSGMSMDGVNLVCAKISGHFPELKVETIGSKIIPYRTPFRQRLLAARTCHVAEVATLNRLVAEEFSDHILSFVRELQLDPNDIDAIGSHGQTLFHGTAALGKSGIPGPVTLQVGDSSLIAERTGILTVANFRQRDLAAGGQGAPLVAFADYVLYRRPDGSTIAMNNLGSISNVTVVPANFDDVLAFDTGPANMCLDYFAATIKENTDGFDRNGTWSAQGRIIESFLTSLLSIPYLRLPPPKAAGYDEFGPLALAKIALPYSREKPVDLLRTAVEFTALSITDAYKTIVMKRFPSLSEIYFSGGGIYNRTLIDRVRAHLPSVSIQTLDSAESDAKEALAFAILAHETICGRPSNVPGATGAKRAVVLGEIAI